MVILVPSNTYAALRAARTRGLIVRDFVWFKARNRSTDALETVGISSEAVALTIDVTKPDTGTVTNRVYQPGAGLMSIPPIPSTLKLEERRLRLTFSRLSPAIINAVKVFDVKGEPVEIHRTFFDPDSRLQVDPAHCRFDGFVRSVRIKKAKAGDDGAIYVDIVDHSASLRVNPVKISKAHFKARSGDRGGDHIDAEPRIVWGQKQKVHERKRRRPVKLWKK